MVFGVSMPQSEYADHESEGYHAIFERQIVDDVDAKQGKAREEQGQQRTMDGTGNGGGNTERIPIYFAINHRTNIVTCNFVAKYLFV